MEVLEPDGIRGLVSDWRTHLRARSRADSTIDAYLDGAGMGMVAPDIGRKELERY